MTRLAVVLVLLVAALSGGVGRSQAVFVASSANPTTFSAAAVFNAVAVTLSDPGTPLRGTVALDATATSDRAIVSVRFQSAPAGSGTWTDRCTDTSAAYTCDWDTKALADGYYDLRAIALDASGYSQTSTVTGRRVDNTDPGTTLTNPGTPLTGTRALSATASDTGGSGVASVAIEYRSSSGAWTQICSDASAPYSCSWNTAALADDLYDLRSVATDNAGNTGTAVVSNRRVDNNAPTISVTDDGTAKRGTVTLQSTTGDGNGSGVASVTYRYRTSPAGAWTTACTSASGPFSCSWNTGPLTDGLYDLQAIATDGVSLTTTSATVSAVRVDNTVPATTTMTSPGTPLSGSVTLSGAATDAGSGMASVRFQYAPTGTTTWADACSDVSTPYSCNWDTTAITDGVYDMRALATDNAGNTRASTTIASRRVDNFAPTVSVVDPGSPIRGTLAIAANAYDGGGVASVTIQRKPTSGSTWTTLCTDNASPFSCSLNTTTLTDGGYDFQAIATDNAGRTTTSPLVANRVVDNTGPRASAVTSTSGGSAGTLGAGDRFTFTFTEAIAPASLVGGWTGTSRAVSVYFGRAGARTTAVVTDTATGTTVPLGTVRLNGVFTNNPGVTFSASMGLSGATLTLTLSGAPSGAVLADTVPTTIDWTNTTTVIDIAGNAGVATGVSGSGQL